MALHHGGWLTSIWSSASWFVQAPGAPRHNVTKNPFPHSGITECTDAFLQVQVWCLTGMSGTYNLPKQNLLLTGFATLVLMVLPSEAASANSLDVVQEPLHEAFIQLRDHASQRVLLSARVQMLAGTRRRVTVAGTLLRRRTNYYRQLTLAA